jgi:hypothetical protein
MTDSPKTNGIGLLNEKPLHAALKEWCARPGDRFEVPLEGYVIDIIRGDQLIEIQTGNFSAIGRKLRALLENHPLRLVYPIAQEKWLLKAGVGPLGRPQRRKSPKRGGVGELFRELVRIPELLERPNFAIEVLLIQEEEVRRHEPRRAWRRRGWVTEERRLLAVVSQQRFETPADLWALTGDDLPPEFTTAELAAALGEPRWLAQKAAYCYRKMGLISQIGKRGNAILYVHNYD